MSCEAQLALKCIKYVTLARFLVCYQGALACCMRMMCKYLCAAVNICAIMVDPKSDFYASGSTEKCAGGILYSGLYVHV